MPYENGLPKYAEGTPSYDSTVEFLKKHEGFKDTTYLDGNGIPTIGYGFTDSSLVKKGTMSRAEADRRLKQEVAARESVLSKMKNWDKLSEDSKTALRSYYYNYPAGFKSTTRFMKAWNAGNYEEAIRQVDAGMNDKNNPGLRKRRLEEQALLKADPFLRPVQTIQPTPIVNQSVSTAVRPTIPAEQTVPAYDPTISPYISGKPMLKLRPRIQLPNLIELMEDSEWEPGFPGLKNGKLPGYWKGTSGWNEDESTQKAEQWADDWQFRLTPAARSKVVQKWNATGERPKPESSEQYTKRRTKETEWKKPSGRKMLEIAPAVVDAVPIASDVKQALEAGAAALRGNYLEASLLSGGLLLPGLFKKTGKNSLKFLSKDELYKAAVERGDKQEALRLLEDAYLNSGVNKTPIVVGDDGHAVGWFHGSEWGNHTIFDSSAMNATIGGSSAAGKVKGNFLTTDLPSAKRYAGSSRYSTTEDPKTTTPNTFVEKLQNLFGAYQPRFLYPAERVGGYAPKPERLFDTHGLAPINHLDKTDNVVYPMYVNPGENPMVLDFNGKPWSQSPVQFPNNFYLKRYIRDDEAKTYRDVIIPFKDKETAMEAWMSDPINVYRGVTNLDDNYFDEGIRSISAYNSAPRHEEVKLIEELVPNTTNGAVQTAAKEGNSSVLMKNVIDSNGGPNGQHYAIDDLATLKSEQMKLADITYDDAGNLIPLSKRFDWTNPDIRYMLAPFLIGGAGYGAYNRLSSYKNGKSPIHIKPANRGKFTALKKRTGHSASWFKENGTPAQKKMAVFALNAKKWKH